MAKRRRHTTEHFICKMRVHEPMLGEASNLEE